MSVHPEMRFTCDRCQENVTVLLNDQPANARAQPPSDWLAMWTVEVTSPAYHLCSTCVVEFKHFMSNLPTKVTPSV